MLCATRSGISNECKPFGVRVVDRFVVAGAQRAGRDLEFATRQSCAIRAVGLDVRINQFRAGMKIGKALGWAALAAIAAAAVVAPQLLLQNSARAYMISIGIPPIDVQIQGTRMPCNGYFDVGFNVMYMPDRAAKPEYDSGRVCRPIFSAEWKLYPEQN